MTSRTRTEQDEAFARFCTTGDPAELARVHDLVAPKLLQLARRVLRSREGSEDAVQATFLTAIEKASSWDTTRPVDRWLTGILVNHVRAMGRRERRRIDPWKLGARELETRTPDAAASHAELVATFDDELERLPDAWREPLALRVTEELSASEIAAKLRRPAGTVRSQLARALRRMRTRIAHALSVVLVPVGLGRLTRAERTVRLGVAPATSGVTAATLGVLLMTKALTATLVIALIAGAIWMLDEPATIATPQVDFTASASLPTIPSPVTPEAEPAALLPLDAEADAAPKVQRPSDESPDEKKKSITVPLIAIDASGAPVPDARIFRNHSVTDSGENEFLAQTDSAGLATITLEGIGNPFFIEHDDVGRSLIVTAVNAPEGRPFRIHLLPPARVNVTVTDAFGAPVANMRVSASVFMTTPDIREFVSSGTTAGAAHVEQQATNSLGRAQLLLDAGMTYDVSAYEISNIEKRTQTHPVTPVPGETITLELKMSGAFLVTGTVRDADGQTVTGAHVKTWFTDPLAAREAGHPEPPAFGHAALVGDDGSYENRLWTTGEFLMMAVTTKRDRRSLPVGVTVDENQPRHHIDFDLLATTSIGGHALDASGAPLEGVRVDAKPPSEKPEGGLRFGRDVPHPSLLWGSASTETNADGAFTLDGLVPGGMFNVSVRGTTLVQSDVMAGTEGVVLQEKATVSWSLRVRAPDGHAMKGQLVSVASKSADGTIKTTPARYFEKDNLIQVDGLARGDDVSISVAALTGRKLAAIRSADSSSMKVGPAFDSTLATTELPWTRVDGPRTLDVTLIPSGSLHVAALDESGRPWPYALVTLERIDEHQSLRPYLPLNTDETGVATFEGLDPGRYRISSMADGKAIEAPDVAVILSGATTTAQISR